MEIIEQDTAAKDTLEPSAFKQRLGEVRRRIKNIDLRGAVIDHPFPAVGIGFAAGALLGLIRPMPKRSRISNALFAAGTALAFRFIREAAFKELGAYARDLISNKNRDVDAERAGGEERPF